MPRLTEKSTIIAVVGPTSSGKTRVGVALAHRFNGEIVSADSRQVYRYMDIGTGKDLGEYNARMTNGNCQMSNIKTKNTKNIGGVNRFKSMPIPYHLIDIVHPNTEYNLGKFLKAARRAIADIQKRGKLPIVVGGTGLWAQALVEGFTPQRGSVDDAFRKKILGSDADRLFKRLKAVDQEFASRMDRSDRMNKQRLVRYLERAQNGPLGEMKVAPDFESLVIGLTHPLAVLRERIEKRLHDRLDNEGLVDEVARLHYDRGVSWKRLMAFGLEYRFVSRHLLGRLGYDEMTLALSSAIYQFSRRQMSWLRRWERQGRTIKWVQNEKEAGSLVADFIDNDRL